jgi:hypothetical protein
LGIKVCYDEAIYWGTIKSFWPEKGFGFVNPMSPKVFSPGDDVPALQGDVFLHKNQKPADCNMLDPVYFRVEHLESGSKIQARHVVKCQDAKFGSIALDAETRSKVLVVRPGRIASSATGHLDARWYTLPKGTANWRTAESPQSCAARELRDVAGLDVHFPAKSPHISVGEHTYFLCTVPQAAVAPFGPGSPSPTQWRDLISAAADLSLLQDTSGNARRITQPHAQIWSLVQAFVKDPPEDVPIPCATPRAPSLPAMSPGIAGSATGYAAGPLEPGPMMPGPWNQQANGFPPHVAAAIMRGKGKPPAVAAEEPRRSGFTWTVTIQKEYGQLLGIEADPKNGLVRAIDPGGLLDLWNRRNPQNALIPGDRLLSANGVSGEAMYGQEGSIGTTATLDLIVERDASAKGGLAAAKVYGMKGKP